MVSPEEDVVAVPVIRPWASRLVVAVPLVLEVPVVLPCASRKVVLSVFDCEAVPVVLPCASLNVVLVPDVLVVVEDLPFSSLSVAFLPTRVEAGSAKARTRISFMDGLDDIGLEIFTCPSKAQFSPFAVFSYQCLPSLYRAHFLAIRFILALYR